MVNWNATVAELVEGMVESDSVSEGWPISTILVKACPCVNWKLDRPGDLKSGKGTI